MKHRLVLTLTAATLLIAACGDNHQQPQTQQPTGQYVASPTAGADYTPQPQYQPQTIQQPAPQPIIINQQPAQNHSEGSGLGSFALGAAAGAVAGHLMTKDTDIRHPSTTQDVDDHYVRPSTSHSYSGPSVDTKSITPPTPVPTVSATPVPPVAKTNHMDTAKFGTHGLHSTVQPKPATATHIIIAKPSAMNMSKLSSVGKR